MNLNELKAAIADEKYKVISFDIFDTLVKRPCVAPTDILKLVGKRCGYQGDFLTMRRIAEKEARRNKLFWEDEISYDDIYREFEELFDVSHEKVEEFKKTELDVEFEYLSARESMLDIFEYALEIGKEVIIVSDIYLPYQFMERVLNNCGYKGYSRLYLSSEYKCCKNTGKLYEIVKNDYLEKGIIASEILHMGDNENSDVNIARKQGLSVQFIPRIEWLYRKNRKTFLIYDYSITSRYADDTFLIGWAINKIYDDPFIEYDNITYFNGDLNIMGQIVLAPMILSFLKLVLQNEHNKKNSVIGVYAEEECYAQKLIEVLNIVCMLNKDIISITPSEMELVKNVDVCVGKVDDIKVLCQEHHECREKRLYSIFLSAVDKYILKDFKMYGAREYDYDTNRSVPIMNCLIDSIMFETSTVTEIDKLRDVIEVYIKSFVRTFRKDLETLSFDFTLFCEFYERFLMGAIEKDAKILKGISIKNKTLYENSEKNLYEQWYKSHNKH